MADIAKKGGSYWLAARKESAGGEKRSLLTLITATCWVPHSTPSGVE